MSENIFEIATRKKLRFQFRGLCSVEDLWDIPLKSLDEMYKVLMSEKKAQSEDSLLEDKSQASSDISLGIDILTHIVQTRLDEQKVAKGRKAKAERKQKLMEILADKQDEALKNLDVEELTRLINES